MEWQGIMLEKIITERDELLHINQQYVLEIERLTAEVRQLRFILKFRQRIMAVINGLS